MNKTTPDMWELASALYLHGPNVDHLQGALPDWTRADIEYVLRKFKNKADRDRNFIQKGRRAAVASQPYAKKPKNEPDIKDINAGQSSSSAGAAPGPNSSKSGSTDSAAAAMGIRDSTQAALLSWSELLSKVHGLLDASDQSVFGLRLAKTTPIKDHSQLLSKVMLYSACFEDHYHGGHPDETCYSEIYRYLSQLLSGEEPTQLRPRSAAKVLQLLDKLTEVLSSGGLNDRLSFLVNKDLSSISKASRDGNADSETASGAESCKQEQKKVPLLFEEPEDSASRENEDQMTIDEQCDALDSQDPYFPEKREALNKKLEALQQTTVGTLTDMPGINPMGLPASLLTKPLAAFPSTYPARLQCREETSAPKKFSLRHRPIAKVSDGEEE